MTFPLRRVGGTNVKVLDHLSGFSRIASIITSSWTCLNCLLEANAVVVVHIHAVDEFGENGILGPGLLPEPHRDSGRSEGYRTQEGILSQLYLVIEFTPPVRRCWRSGYRPS